LGIVAAVLGVIKTMGSIDRAARSAGPLIGGALVGTFLGVFVAYGFFGPMAQALRNIYEAEHKYFLSMKTGLLAHMQGYAPVMAVEFARKALMSEDRPTFAEIDEATAACRTSPRRSRSRPGHGGNDQPIIIKKIKKGGTPITAARGRSPMPTS
jgi:chemotaxis protein MotA